jgi:phytoene dehydrogenase-like protein
VYATLVAGWIGAPPSRASFLAWAATTGTYIEDGAYYCRGSFQRLVDAFVAGLGEHGGELLLGTRVARILGDGRRVTGIELDGGGRIAAPTIARRANHLRGAARRRPAAGALPTGAARTGALAVCRLHACWD